MGSSASQAAAGGPARAGPGPALCSDVFSSYERHDQPRCAASAARPMRNLAFVTCDLFQPAVRTTSHSRALFLSEVLRDRKMQVLQQPDVGAQLFFQQARFQPTGPPPLPMGPSLPLPGQPPLPAGPPPVHTLDRGRPVMSPASLAYQQQQHQQGAAHPAAQQQQQQQQQQPGGKRKKRGRRGSGLDSRSRGVQKQRGGGLQLGFFGQVPSLSDMRQENWRRTQQHYGGGSAAAAAIAGPLRPFSGAPKQHHGRQSGPGKAAHRCGSVLRLSRSHALLPAAPFFLADAPMCPPPRTFTGSSRAGSHRRARNKASKQAKLLHPPSAPRPKPLTPAGMSVAAQGHVEGGPVARLCCCCFLLLALLPSSGCREVGLALGSMQPAAPSRF